MVRRACYLQCKIFSNGLFFVVEQNKQLKHSPSLPRKHPYALNVSGSHSNSMERTDWWELLYYLKQLDASKLDRILPMLASYDVKVSDIVIMVNFVVCVLPC